MNMKTKYLFIAIAFASLFSACNRDEASIFDKSAAERAEWTLQNAKEVLVAQDAWEMLYFANRDSRGYNVVVKFTANGKVIATANNAATTKGVMLTDSSTWVVRNDYGPIISFDTYNTVLHAWADPQEDGDGLLGDYEFLILEATTERVVLKGKKHSAYAVMRPMPKVNVEEYFTTCNSQLNKYFSNGAIMTLSKDDKSYYLHNGATGIFTRTAVGEPVPEADPEIFPICPTLDGFVVCYAFNSELYVSRGAAMEHVFTLKEDKFVGEQGSTISAGDLNLLFMTYIANNKGWKADLTASTGTFAAAVEDFTEALIAQSKDSKAKLNSVAITYSDTLHRYQGGYVLRIKFEYKKNGKGTKQTPTMDYVINAGSKDGKIAISYISAANEAAANWYAQLPAMANLVNTVMDTFTLTAGDPLNPAADMRLNTASTMIVTSGSSSLK